MAKSVHKKKEAKASLSVKSPESNFSFFVSEFRKCSEEIQKDNLSKVREVAFARIKEVVNKSGLGEKYKIVFLLQDDDYSISSNTLDDIYATVKNGEKDKELLMILNSPGGYIGPAYFISKCCKEYSKLFYAAVPRRAKSAATLITLGADQVHMGSISELGPIDPQIRRMPALALGDAVDFIASVTSKYPDSSEMFARLLSRELDLQTLGHTRRLAESAVAYAVRLLGKKKLPMSAKEVGNKLVNEYKDHGFVIEKEEARSILGEQIIQFNTPEYELADNVYKLIEDMKLALWVVTRKNYNINFVGGLDEARTFWIQKEKED